MYSYWYCETASYLASQEYDVINIYRKGRIARAKVLSRRELLLEQLPEQAKNNIQTGFIEQLFLKNLCLEMV